MWSHKVGDLDLLPAETNQLCHLEKVVHLFVFFPGHLEIGDNQPFSTYFLSKALKKFWGNVNDMNGLNITNI